ncbi:hypothetical protein Tco_1033119 [Tanacetum coccineum]|uniref:Uncharacterized protein n=1 Tax=Tanacetum coccineum TaxID=301880 RepID=A0ABQ5GEQ6_9ASTR
MASRTLATWHLPGLSPIRRRFLVSGRNSGASRTAHCPGYWRRSTLGVIDIIAIEGLTSTVSTVHFLVLLKHLATLSFPFDLGFIIPDGEGDLGLLRDDDGKSDGDDDEPRCNPKSPSSSIDGKGKASSPVGSHTKSVCDLVIVISSSELDMMTSGANTPARGVVTGKLVGRGVVIVL